MENEEIERRAAWLVHDLVQVEEADLHELWLQAADELTHEDADKLRMRLISRLLDVSRALRALTTIEPMFDTSLMGLALKFGERPYALPTTQNGAGNA